MASWTCNIYLLTLFLPLTIGALTPLFTRKVIYVEGNYAQTISVRINDTSEYIVSFPPVIKQNPFRILASSLRVNIDEPVLVVVRQEKEVLSWQLPMVIKNQDGLITFKETARTLCYNPEANIRKYFRSHFENERSFSISLSTASASSVDVVIQANEVQDYNIKDNINYTVTTSPSKPAFYYYSFEGKENRSTVFISVDSKDDACLTMSVQNSLCPVRDLNKEIGYEGKFQALTTKGGMMIRRAEYPNGFFLVFVAKADNFQCTQESVILPSPRGTRKIFQNRTTTLQFKVTPGSTETDYVHAVLIIFGSYLGFCILFMGIVVLSYRLGKLRTVSMNSYEIEDDEDVPPRDEVDCYKKEKVYVMDLDYYEKFNQRKSFNYLWHIMNIGLFYGIPVVQLMFSYQRAVFLSGDQDICYHNLYCAHPLGGLSDFNHIYSNIGYVMVGILFLCITFFKQKIVKQRPRFGIPIHYGLFYSMGIALIIEGLMSACYHICPNQSNYQFDTSFMYVMAVLVTIKLYQNRHPDINASAYATFAVVGFAICIAMFGILSGSIAIMVIFTLCYISLCLYLSFKVYFFGDVLNGCKFLYGNVKEGDSFLESVKPLRTGRFVLLIVANICNYAMAGVGLYLYPSRTDFGTYLLAILMGNAILHTIFYICMKLYHKERICMEGIFYGLLSMAAWGSSGVFFLNNSTQWAVTPAESKQLNNECLIMGFYDQHDIWHMLSAPALLFSFMLLLCIDDDLADKEQEEIEVF